MSLLIRYQAGSLLPHWLGSTPHRMESVTKCKERYGQRVPEMESLSVLERTLSAAEGWKEEGCSGQSTRKKTACYGNQGNSRGVGHLTWRVVIQDSITHTNLKDEGSKQLLHMRQEGVGTGKGKGNGCPSTMLLHKLRCPVLSGTNPFGAGECQLSPTHLTEWRQGTKRTPRVPLKSAYLQDPETGRGKKKGLTEAT